QAVQKVRDHGWVRTTRRQGFTGGQFRYQWEAGRWEAGQPGSARDADLNHADHANQPRSRPAGRRPAAPTASPRPGRAAAAPVQPDHPRSRPHRRARCHLTASRYRIGDRQDRQPVTFRHPLGVPIARKAHEFHPFARHHLGDHPRAGAGWLSRKLVPVPANTSKTWRGNSRSDSADDPSVGIEHPPYLVGIG
ncbi:MAG: hypothetical protein JWQ55_6577, partial [Rhodopila sp.]|nr:hypothetical protein [Rhodopila sp.]